MQNERLQLSDKQRLEKIIKFSKLSVNAFAKTLGLDRSTKIYHILNGRNGISEVIASLISTKYNIRYEWVLNGVGEMFENEQYPSKTIVTEREEDKILPGILKDRNVSIPYYDIEISAGTVSFYKDYPELPHTSLEIPFVQGVDLAMPVYGDSMYPKIKNGDIVLLKEIHDKTVIMFGEIYLVITEDYRTLKYIRKHPTSEEKILLVSENERYDPVPMALNNVIHLFLYKGKFEKSQI